VLDDADPADILEAVLDRTGYRAELEESDDPQDATRVDNLTELVTVAREFAENTVGEPVDADAAAAADAPAQSLLDGFLERVSLVSDADSVPDPDADGDPEEQSGVVTLMTVHTAKGLEYPVVFCTGWEDGVFPHMRALSDPTELAEERRLAYVAITRARERLYVSRALVRAAWGSPVHNPASRFLDEIPADLVEWRREEPVESPAGPRAATRWGR